MISVITLDRLRLPVQADTPGRSSSVWGAEVTLRRGERYMIRAASGTGKSSLCAFLFGSRSDYRGTIRFDGKEVRSFTPARWCGLRRTSLAYLSQDAPLFGQLTVAENIDIKNRLTRHRSPQWIAEALESLDVADKTAWRADRLSVGQRQRVAAVRALCQPFDFLLLDEPVSHLDPERASALARLIDLTAAAEGAGVIITSVGVDLPLADAATLTL